MAPETIGIIAIICLVALILLRMWIGVAMGLVGFIGLIALRGSSQALMMVGEVPFSNINSYTLTVIPMFVLLGMLIAESRLGSDLFHACDAWLGRIRGGLGSATIVASGLFGAICGSHMVGTVVMSKIAYPEMRRYNYNDSFAASVVSAGAPLSIIIPPSLPLIMYGILTEQSIGKLFMTGIGPGIVMIVIFICIISIRCAANPSLGPKGKVFTMRERLVATKGIIPIVILFVIVLGGIYTGIFTTTESGAIGSFGAIIITLVYKTLNGKTFGAAMKETAMTMGMIFSLLLGTYIFIRFIAYSKIPFMFSGFIIGLDVSKPMLILVLCVIYIILGMIIPEIPMLLLTVPILYPALIAVGFDPLWLGIFIVIMMALGSITPPIGMVVFIVSGLTKVEVPRLFKACVPFIIGDLLVVLILCLFPQLATFIPSLM